MQITIRPCIDPTSEIDITDRLVEAIARELYRRYGGNADLNWIEAERHLERIAKRPSGWFRSNESEDRELAGVHPHLYSETECSHVHHGHGIAEGSWHAGQHMQGASS